MSHEKMALTVTNKLELGGESMKICMKQQNK